MALLNLDRDQPGFRPNSKYGKDWYGNLLDTHPDFSKGLFGKNDNTSKELSTSGRFDLTKNLGSKSFTGPYTTRDYLAMFGDTSTDYFKNGLHVIDGKTPLQNDPTRTTSWDGAETAPGLRLSNFEYTPYENNDPVFFGFELVIDGINSPLLNGSVKDFINKVCLYLNLKINWIGKGLSERGIINKKVFIEVNKDYFRPAEVDQLIGDSSKAYKIL